MAVRRLELTNQNDETRFLLRLQSRYTQSAVGWKEDLEEAFTEAGINNELSELTGWLPSSDAFDLADGDWGNLSTLQIETGMVEYLSYPTSSGGGDYTLEVNTEYKHSNGRYVKVERNNDYTKMRFVVYDTDDSVIYTGNYFSASGRMLRYYCCPEVVRANDTFADFQAGCGCVELLVHVRPNTEPIEVTSYYVYGAASSDYEKIYPVEWIYYLLHDPQQDVPIPDEPEPEPITDPYGPYDPSGPNPGTDDPDDPYDPGDPIVPPGLPGWDPSDSGFLKIFIPSQTVLGLLSSKLWDTNFFTTVLKEFIADPRDAIISLGCVPFNVTPSGTAEIKVGVIGTGISSAYVNSPYVDIDCGSVEIKPIVNGYTDYSPYTDMYLYLPYIGSVQLDTDIYMGQRVNIKYRCDILTGECLAFIIVGGNIKAAYNGNIRFSVPITSADYSQAWNTFISMATGALLGVAGAAAAGAEAGAVDVAQGAIKGGAGKLTQSAGIKPQIQISGQLQSTNGLLGIQKPYIEIRRPNLCIPDGQKAIEGYPALMTARIGAFSGYTEIEEVHLSVSGASAEELDEIKRLLMEGVIL